MIAVIVVVVALAAAGWSGYRYLSRPSCHGATTTLTVAAAPEIAPAVRQAADGYLNTRANGRTCLAFTITPADSADIASAVAGLRSGSLTGLGQASGRLRAPQVWIPDSSLWLTRLRGIDPKLVPAQAPPLARSPVVLAMPEPVAKELGWPDTKLTWSALLTQMITTTNLRTGIVNPARDAAGLSGLLAMAAVAQADPANGQQTTVAALRALAAGESAIRGDLLGRFPRAIDPATLAAGLGAAPLTEQAVIEYNATQPPVPLAPLYLEPAPVGLDYPFTVLPTGDATVIAAAEELRSALSGAGFAGDLAKDGLRAADGSEGPGFPAVTSAPRGPLPALATIPAAAIDQLLSTWTAVTQPGRMLAVIDVSGSMLTPVPTAGGATREQVTVRAAEQGLSLFDDKWALGLWVFSTNMIGTQPWHQLLPIGPLAVQRTQAIAALGGIQPKQNGDTGLYDTLLAAYRTVQKDWDPGRVNSVVLFTDGQNDNPGGLTLDQLTAELKKSADPAKPIQIIIIGIGSEPQQGELDRIVGTTGGGAFIVQDPTKIGDVFLRAIALRPRPAGR